MSQDLSNVVELFPGCLNPGQKSLMRRLRVVHANINSPENHVHYAALPPGLANLHQLRQDVLAHALFMENNNGLREDARETIEAAQAVDEILFRTLGIDKLFETARQEATGEQ